MCVLVGMAWSVLVALPVLCLPWALSVQAPSGPRKSGIPEVAIVQLYIFPTAERVTYDVTNAAKGRAVDSEFATWISERGIYNSPAEVEIPAPVKAIKCLLFLMSSTNREALASRMSRASRRSGSASLGALSAMV